MEKLWNRLSRLGIADEISAYERKSLIILNQLALLLIPMAITMGSVLFFVFKIYVIGIGLWINASMAFLILWLNAVGKSHISRILFSVVPVLTFAIGSPLAKMFGTSRSVVFYIAPRIGLIIMCLVPLFLFGFRRDWRLVLSMALPISCFLLFDYIHVWFGIDWRTFPMRYEEYPAIIFATSGLLVFIIFSTLFIQKINADYEKQVLKQGEEIALEKQKSENLLHNILPEEVAQELKEKGSATPKHYELITVLFTDFKGFTNIAEKISPTEVIENLNTCFLAFDNICDKYGLEKIKTIGDSYMCAGGLPVANTTNPVDVVLAGLEMQDFMTRWIAEKQARGQEVWELRLGIHSGEAVAGVVGKNKFAYDIWGDTVNLASRMESSGEVGKVNISGTTYALIKDKFVCTFRGKIQAKNKGEVEMYFVEKSLL
ncbi:MAG: adenylate/guanylate cyclase domain-containing protein [Bacteroidetes bacterium]|nr:MAG: adenylate/guanylate cyclase domain-containing protein [Bacteroidota bacterium]